MGRAPALTSGHRDARVEVRSSSIHGHGVFARVQLPRRAVVTFYDGERVDWPTACARNPSHMRTIATFHEAIDGLRAPCARRGMGSFANHSDHPNADLVVYNDECFVRTRAPVLADHELLVDYGRTYWRRAAARGDTRGASTNSRSLTL